MENPSASLKTPLRYYALNVLTTLALAAIALIPASMAYNIRAFQALSLPAWLVEFVAFVILFAPSVAILVTGLVRTFAVSDSEHAQAMTQATVLEGLACLFEIIAALIAGDDWLAHLGRIVFLGGAVGCVFAALALTLTQNGYYKLLIARNERSLLWHTQYSKLLKEEMQTDEVRNEMRAAIKHNIRDAAETEAGRQLYERTPFNPTPMPAQPFVKGVTNFLSGANGRDDSPKA